MKDTRRQSDHKQDGWARKPVGLILGTALLQRLGRRTYAAGQDADRFAATNTSADIQLVLDLLEVWKFAVLPERLDRPEILRPPSISQYPLPVLAIYAWQGLIWAVWFLLWNRARGQGKWTQA